MGGKELRAYRGYIDIHHGFPWGGGGVRQDHCMAIIAESAILERASYHFS